jgi:hypothetical protein
MTEMLQLQGRQLSAADVESIRQLISVNPEWSRRRISEQLAGQWNWRNGVGQLKDMAARSLLLKLHQRGLVQLPPRRFAPTNRMRSQRVEVLAWDQSPIHCSLDCLGPLQVREVNLDGEERTLFVGALCAFHYLGHGGTVGENLRYVVRDAQDRPLAFLLFGSAAWKCQDRDRFIGWTPEQRERNLGLLTNNTRFLILPWVKVPHLASWALGTVLRRLSRDWQRKYGHPIALVETFVQRDRFAGTAYRAANWKQVGQTTGRTRQDRCYSIQAPVKDIYLYPLGRRFREELAV